MSEPQLDSRWTPLYTLASKETQRFCRVLGQTLLVPFVNACLYLLIFGVSLGNYVQLSHQFSYLAFLVPGFVMMGVINNAFQNTSSSIATSKFHGDLEDLRKAPISSWQILWGMSVGGLIRGLAVGGVIMIAGQGFHYFTLGGFVPIKHPFAFLYFLTVGGLCFSQLGICLGFWSKSIDQLSAVGGFILMPLIYLGGVFFSLDQLHPVWQTIAQFNPVFYFIHGVRYGMLGFEEISWLTAAAVSLVALVVVQMMALRVIRHGNYSRW